MTSALSDRLKDQSSLVREIGDKAEDVVWSRFKRYTVIFGVLLTVILGFVAFVGIRTLDDVSNRIEPVVKAAEQRALVAKQTIEETAIKVDAVKASLDELSRDVDAQTKRAVEASGEISRKLESLETAANEAQKRGETYRARSEELSARLEAMEKSLETKVAQVSKQVDNVTIRQAYPTLGEQKFITFQSGRWKGKQEKAPTDRWINIYIAPTAVGNFSPDQLEKLVAELKNSGYTPLLGMFGVGGPYASGFGPLGNSSKTTVFYFQNDAKQMAIEVSEIVSRTLSIKPLEPQFVNVASFGEGDDRKFLLENAGLDMQLYILR